MRDFSDMSANYSLTPLPTTEPFSRHVLRLSFLAAFSAGADTFSWVAANREENGELVERIELVLTPPEPDLLDMFLGPGLSKLKSTLSDLIPRCGEGEFTVSVRDVCIPVHVHSASDRVEFQMNYSGGLSDADIRIANPHQTDVHGQRYIYGFPRGSNRVEYWRPYPRRDFFLKTVQGTRDWAARLWASLLKRVRRSDSFASTPKFPPPPNP